MNTLSESQAAYLAGLIDADGTVTLSRRHRNKNRIAAVSLSNTDKQLLNTVKTMIGAGTICGKLTTSPKHSQSYTYAVYNRQALAVLESIAVFLNTYKKLRARLILDHYVRLTPRNGKYSQLLVLDRKRFEKAVLAIKPNQKTPFEP